MHYQSSQILTCGAIEKHLLTLHMYAQREYNFVQLTKLSPLPVDFNFPWKIYNVLVVADRAKNCDTHKGN